MNFWKAGRRVWTGLTEGVSEPRGHKGGFVKSLRFHDR